MNVGQKMMDVTDEKNEQPTPGAQTNLIASLKSNNGSVQNDKMADAVTPIEVTAVYENNKSDPKVKELSKTRLKNQSISGN